MNENTRLFFFSAVAYNISFSLPFNQFVYIIFTDRFCKLQQTEIPILYRSKQEFEMCMTLGIHQKNTISQRNNNKNTKKNETHT